MRVQERIRAIRLIESAEKNKKYAIRLGIDANVKKRKRQARSEQQELQIVLWTGMGNRDIIC